MRIFEPSDHESGWAKLLSSTSDGLHVDFAQRYCQKFQLEHISLKFNIWGIFRYKNFLTTKLFSDKSLRVYTSIFAKNFNFLVWPWNTILFTVWHIISSNQIRFEHMAEFTKQDMSEFRSLNTYILMKLCNIKFAFYT